MFYETKKQSRKKYELAHIYPFSPTPSEEKLLIDEERLSNDVNDEKNLIPLCVSCHTQFDKPRTVEGYRRVYAIKKALIKKAELQELIPQYQIEADIKMLIVKLYDDSAFEEIQLALDPKEVDKKLSGQISNLTKQKIKHYVSTYFALIKKEFAAMDALNPESANLIASQVRSFYLRQKKANLSQQEIFQNLVSWVSAKTQPATVEASEILISFFVQNCEVFE
ncbi:MAG TPA: ABC-three component system protein [Herbaspirillum sp.]|uniref:ABC-three component system protein n=1 Tax=Herbaspirillum sp. TaxID=1890675 RepID=UPI002D5E39A3|nr:ABC-three component system protein [Herbaspirillum sp.]HZG20429.1 ABC-three component system protein [Herbaspirillum sp.]